MSMGVSPSLEVRSGQLGSMLRGALRTMVCTERILPGNQMLDDLVGGNHAGSHAGAWVKDASFGGSTLVEKAVVKSSKRVDTLKSGNGVSVGQASATLSSVMASCTNGSRDESSLKAAAMLSLK